MPPLPPRDHRIPKDRARGMSRRYRDSLPAPRKHGACGCTFHADQVRQLLDQAGVKGLRIYLATESDGSPAIVLMGADANNNDMDGGMILELGFPCPPYCDEG